MVGRIVSLAENILVVDDGSDVRANVADYLRRNGLRVSVVVNEREMLSNLQSSAFDLVLIDNTKPGNEGLSLCQALRNDMHNTMPILLTSARNGESDRVMSLESGADDYSVKPFSLRELLARIKAVMRRTNLMSPQLRITETQGILKFGRWRLNTLARHLVDRDDTAVTLRNAEFRLLQAFLGQPHRVLSSDVLFNLVQGRAAGLFDRSIHLLASRLCRRLEDGVRE